MTNLFWIILLAYVFGIGYYVVGRIDRFVRSNPRAFPGTRKIVFVPQPSWTYNMEDDRSCNPWYNDCTYFEELESHEECNS